MTRIDPAIAAARLALVQRQRRFEWALAREEHGRAASRLVSGKTHDLMNLVQIVQLATYELKRRCGASIQEFVDDLTRAAADATTSLRALMEVARPEIVVVRGPAVRAVLARTLDALRPAVVIEAQLTLAETTTTALDEEALTHLLLGLALDAADAPRIELLARDRTIDGAPWLELVRGTHGPTAGDGFELRTVELLARRIGGELARSDRRGGGTELVVALPVLPA